MTSGTPKKRPHAGPSQREVDAFCQAAYVGNVEVLAKFLSTYGAAQVNRNSQYDNSALQQAAEGGRMEAVKLLLEAGADVNQRMGSDMSPLVCAVSMGFYEIARLLLEKGADAEAKDDDGRTALIWAAHEGNAAMVDLLLENNAAINEKDTRGFTPLIWAARMGDRPSISALLENGADMDAVSNAGHTALESAQYAHHDEAAALIRQWPEVLRQRKQKELDAEMADFSSALKQDIPARPPLKFQPKRGGPRP